MKVLENEHSFSTLLGGVLKVIDAYAGKNVTKPSSII